MVHAVTDIGEMTAQSESLRSGTCMVSACLYLIAGSFLGPGAAPAMAADLRGATHPFMSAHKTSVHFLLRQHPTPGTQTAPLFAAWDTRESSARAFSTVERLPRS